MIQKLIQTITPQLLIFHLCLNYFNVFMASQLVAFWMLMTCSLLAKIDIWTSIKNSAKAFFASPLSDLFGTMKFMHISPLALFDVSSAFNLVDHCFLLLVLQCFSASFGLTHTIPLGCPSKLFGITDLSYSRHAQGGHVTWSQHLWCNTNATHTTDMLVVWGVATD